MHSNFSHPDVHPSLHLPFAGTWSLPDRPGLFPYDSAQYASGLRHLGTPQTTAGWPVTFLTYPIPGAEGLQAARGPWPYCSPPHGDQVGELRASLARQNLAAFQADFRPDATLLLDPFREAGFEITSQKGAYVFDPGLDYPLQCPRMRYDIQRGRRGWCVEPVCLADYQRTISRYEALLTREKGFRPQSFLPPAHFAALVDLPQVQVLGAFDAAGLGAALITLHWEGKVYFHTMVGAARALRECGFHALLQAAVERWGSSRTLYFGSASDDPDGSEIARIKSRFSNRRIPIFSARIMLNTEALPAPDAVRAPRLPAL